MIDARSRDGVLTLTINRPEKANALTEAMLSKMADCIEETSAQVLVLTGVGGVYSAGADLDDVPHGLAASDQWERLSGVVANFQGLSVAALNGTAAGGALGMVLACDLRVAVATAKFFYPVIKIGVLPQPSDPVRLTALVGPSMAKRILMTGAKISAQDALACGLIDVISENDLEKDVADLIASALVAPRDQLVAIKSMIG